MKRLSWVLIWVLWTGAYTALEHHGNGVGTSVGGLFQWQYSDGFDTKRECEAAAKKAEFRKERPAPNKTDAKNGWIEVTAVIAQCRPAGVQP